MEVRSFALPAIFTGVVVCFVAATAFVHWEMSSIDAAASEIADDSAPGIEQLAIARTDLRHLQQVLRRERERRDAGEAFDLNAIEDARHVYDRSLAGYLARPILERKSWDAVRAGKLKLDVALEEYERETAADPIAAARTLRGGIPAASAELSDAITGALETGAAVTRASALRIRSRRTSSSHIAIGLDIVCTLIALMGALLVHRIVRADRELANKKRELQEERAREMEDFAGRIAHDILSPLGAIGFALDLVKRTDDPTQRRRVVERGTSSMERIQRLVNGLLDFARAGGKPVDGARADVGRVVADLLAELEPACVQNRIELATRQDGHLIAACNPGVLTSMVANLARNAMKYMGDAEVRHIEIRALDKGRSLRVEVQDTGPGLSEELQRRVFDPYVRASNSTQPGVGLGLATVKRLAEAHGGEVGVKSKPGEGAMFWFEIPNAPDRRVQLSGSESRIRQAS